MSVKARATVFVLFVMATLAWIPHLLGQGSPAIAPPWQQMTAKKATHTHTRSTDTWQLRGGVRIVQEKSIISADEVDATLSADGTIDYDLRGNVHLTMNQTK